MPTVVLWLLEYAVLALVERSVSAIKPELLPFAWMAIVAIVPIQIAVQVSAIRAWLIRHLDAATKLSRVMSYLTVALAGAAYFITAWAILTHIFSSSLWFIKRYTKSRALSG